MTGLVMLFEAPSASVTVSVTENAPLSANVNDVSGPLFVLPSLKSQRQDTMLFSSSVDRSWKKTMRPSPGAAGENEKSAAGAWFTEQSGNVRVTGGAVPSVITATNAYWRRRRPGPTGIGRSPGA